MKSFTVAFLCVCLFYGVTGQLLFDYPGFGTYEVEEFSNSVIFEATGFDLDDDTFSVSLTPSADNVTFVPATMIFDERNYRQTVQVLVRYPGPFTVTFALGGTNASDFTAPDDELVSGVPRSFSSPRPSTSAAIVGETTDVITFCTDTPPPGSVNVQVEGNFLEFTPSAFTITNPSVCGTFTARANRTGFFPYTVELVSGSSIELYNGATLYSGFVASGGKGVFLPAISQLFEGQTSTPLYVVALPDDTLQLSGYAADVTFSPATLNLSPTEDIVSFTVAGLTSSNKEVNWELEGTNATDYSLGATSFNVVKRSFSVVDVNFLEMGRSTTVAISIPIPTPTTLTVTPYGPGLTFEPTSATFSGDVTGRSFQVTPENRNLESTFQGGFVVSGADASLYLDPPTFNLGSQAAYGITITQIPSPLVIGVESENFVMHVHVPPTTGITVTPIAPETTFNPPTISFGPNERVNTFRMTSRNTGFRTINFIVKGDDEEFYSAPGGLNLNVAQRQFQFSPNVPFQLPLEQESETITVSVNYPPENLVTLRPVANQALTFDPPVLRFTPGETRQTFTFSGRYFANPTITWVVGEEDAHLFDAPSNSFVSIIAADLDLVRVYSPFELETLPNPSSSNFTLEHQDRAPSFFNFTLDQAPTTDLTVAANSANLIFVPNPVTIPAGQLYGTFEVRGETRGNHLARFELSGATAYRYQTPSNTLFEVDLNQNSLPPPLTAGASTVTSAILVPILAMLALALMN